MRRHLMNLHIALRQVFAHPSSFVVASGFASIALLSAVWLPNFALLRDVFLQPDIAIAAKLGLAVSLLGGIGTNFSPLTAGYTIAIAVLFGVAVAMIAHLVRRRRMGAAGQNIVIGSGAMASGAVGIGCAACGSLILGGLVPTASAAGALALLPLDGAEFGLLSVALLLTSLLLISKSIAESSSCPIARKQNG